MRKSLNRLLIVTILALVLGAIGSSSSYAALRASTWDRTASATPKHGPQLSGAGEPDIGDQKNNPNGDGEEEGPILVGPNGYRWIMMIWARCYLGVDW